MSNALLEYLNNRLGKKDVSDTGNNIPGPLITISREVGCSGVKLAHKMAASLNQKRLGPNWKVLSKEVFFHSAKELDMEPEKVRRFFKYSDNYTFNDILNAFGNKKFKSERKVIKTVNEVIHTFAEEGFCIIVGRAAHIIARDIKNALHVRLIAPCEYRIKTIMHNNHLNREEAIEFINRVEKERKAFRKAIRKEAPENEIFDICLNRASFQDEETIYLIEQAAEKKNIFKDYGRHIDFY
ncbi:cytidylate kinase-like family protein [Mariniphaga sediminis]|jgi:cytidylate kinase|uniref:Cytidylate kinase-like family protein n=1 Tax=Mariniphaga sediminis TaxID=1628158 RepID=A0A399D2Y9_9BACT|nr:cytidylate kinase-like family protein [Mariniphaga sediminis]RIH65071.1 cytidylate kinase-like family protein [Mariniphaga sediminis]